MANLKDRMTELKGRMGVVQLMRLAGELSAPDASGKPCCPKCGSGTHEHGTSALAIDDYAGGNLRCHACGWQGDVFDFVGERLGITNLNERISWVENWLDTRYQPFNLTMLRQPDIQAPALPEPDYSEGRAQHKAFIVEAQNRIDDSEALAYLEGRGINLEIARAHGLGYDRIGKRIVIPYPGSDYYHIDRDITGQAPNKYTKPPSNLVGSQPLWRPNALNFPQFFVVEGPFDAIAVSECGYPCVALCGTASSVLVDACRARDYRGLISILADGDETGWNAAEKTARALGALGLNVYVTQLEGAKDAAELWAGDRHVA